MKLVLDRIRVTSSDEALVGVIPVYGWLTMPNGECFATVERPWRNNTPFESCIPPGEYEIMKHESRRAIRLLGVPSRAGILIHVANWCRELHGCIAPGLGFNSTGGVMASRAAMDRLVLGWDGSGTILIS